MIHSKHTGAQTQGSHTTTPAISILSNSCNNPIFVVALRLRHQSSKSETAVFKLENMYLGQCKWMQGSLSLFMDMYESVFCSAQCQIWRSTNNKKKKSKIPWSYHLCSTSHQHSLHWQLHCIPTSSTSSHSTSAATHLQHRWGKTTSHTHATLTHTHTYKAYHVCGMELFRECMHGEVQFIQSW